MEEKSMIIFLLAIFLIGISVGLGLYCVELEKRVKKLEMEVDLLDVPERNKY